MTQKERIEELEKRVRDLEARPVYVPIVVQPYGRPVSPYIPWTYPYVNPTYPNPWNQKTTWLSSSGGTPDGAQPTNLNEEGI